MTEKKAEDLAVTTAYVYSECMDSNKYFMSSIDNAIDIAKEFIKIYPSYLNWENQKEDWGSTLYKFYLMSI
jgi:hypothetical protein